MLVYFGITTAGCRYLVFRFDHISGALVRQLTYRHERNQQRAFKAFDDRFSRRSPHCRISPLAGITQHLVGDDLVL